MKIKRSLHLRCQCRFWDSNFARWWHVVPQLQHSSPSFCQCVLIPGNAMNFNKIQQGLQQAKLYLKSFIDVFYHQIQNGIQGYTTRAPPLSRGGRVQTGDQTISSLTPWPFGHDISFSTFCFYPTFSYLDELYLIHFLGCLALYLIHFVVCWTLSHSLLGVLPSTSWGAAGVVPLLLPQDPAAFPRRCRDCPQSTPSMVSTAYSDTWFMSLMCNICTRCKNW